MATFTVTHTNASVTGAFTVNYQTVDGSATAGNDYTSIVSGTLNFNGTVGDTESITVFITDDIIFESSETYSIQFTSTSDVSVDISDIATATIVDNEVTLGNTPLTLFEGFDGYIDYSSTGGSLRTQSNSSNSCAVGTSSSNTLSSPIPARQQ
ncbi:MAG: Calx-beta domain-containing protein [Flavobacteriaceae bacterium]